MPPYSSLYLVDDDPVFNLIHSKNAERTNFAHNIRTFELPVSAIDNLRSICSNNPEAFPDIIFLDINMPDMDGWAFLDEFSKLPVSVTGKCKLYMLTSSIDPEDIARSKAYTVVTDFISKPLTNIKLMDLSIELSGGKKSIE